MRLPSLPAVVLAGCCLLGGSAWADPPTDLLAALRAAGTSDAGLFDLFATLSDSPDRRLENDDLRWLQDRLPPPADPQARGMTESLLANLVEVRKAGPTIELDLQEETTLSFQSGSVLFQPRVTARLSAQAGVVRLERVQGISARQGILRAKVETLELYRNAAGAARAKVTVSLGIFGRRTLDMPLRRLEPTTGLTDRLERATHEPLTHRSDS